MAKMRLTLTNNVRQLFAQAGADELSNVFGALPPDIEKRLLAVLNKPTERTWDNAHGIHGASFQVAWRKIGGKGKITYKGLRALKVT